MIWRSKLLQLGVAAAMAGALVAGCTAAPTAQRTTTAELTPGGTLVPLPSRSAVPSPSAPAPSSSVQAASTPALAKTTGTTPTTARPSTSATRPPASTSKTLRSPTVATPTLDTAGLSAQEITDRKEIQAVWINYWQVINRIVRTPKSQRATLLSTVAVQPHIDGVLKVVDSFDVHGWDNYGIPLHALYWGLPVDGSATAQMGDCMDFRAVGKLVAKTGEKLSVGKTGQDFHGIFARSGSGQWRVSAVQYLKGSAC